MSGQAELKELGMFELRPLITNISCKLSAVTAGLDEKQFLCLVTDENEILLRYISASSGQEVVKMISWFRNRVIHDVCFDPAGTWLLVLCEYEHECADEYEYHHPLFDGWQMLKLLCPHVCVCGY